MNILSIDYGTRNIGLALSDETEIVAAKLPHLKVRNQKELEDGILSIIKNINPGKILLGKPQDGAITQAIEGFAEFLRTSTNLEVRFWNEDNSSKQAEKGRSKKFKKNKSHSEAARIILQEYLDSKQDKFFAA